MKIELKGALEFHDDIEDALRLKAAKGVIKHYTGRVAQSAQDRAPYDTGNLKRSIVTRIENNGLKGIIRAGAHYAGYVEYGTRFMSAQPYLRPSVNAIKSSFLRDLEILK